VTNVVVGKKDEIVMKILHYFVTEENYTRVDCFIETIINLF